MMNKIILMVFQLCALSCFAMDSINIADIGEKVKRVMEDLNKDLDKDLDSLIEKAKNNKKLNLESKYNISPSGWEKIALAISSNDKKPDIEEIIIGSKNLDDMNLGAFVMNLPELPRLKSIDISDISRGNVTEDSLAKKMIERITKPEPKRATESSTAIVRARM